VDIGIFKIGLVDNVQRIIQEEFKSEDRNLIGKLSYILNKFMEQVVRQLNGNIDFSNLNEDRIVFKMTVDANGIPIGNNLIKSSIGSARGFTVMSAKNQEDVTVFVTSGPFITTVGTTNTFVRKVEHISGLQNGVEYELIVRVTP